MARQKQTAPLRREPSDFEDLKKLTNGFVKQTGSELSQQREQISVEALSQPGLLQLLICVGGIYAAL